MIVLYILIPLLVIATFIKPAYGFMIYMIIRLCIPPSARFIGLSLNTLSLALFIILSIDYLRRRVLHLSVLQESYIKNIGSYILIILALIVISSITAIVPFTYQVSSFTKYAYTELLPSILLLLVFNNYKDFKIFNYVILVCAIISTTYTIFTFFANSNPIFEMFSTSDEMIVDNAETFRKGMLEGRGVGLTNNKITTSLVSMLFFTYFWGKDFINRYLLNAALILSFIAVILATQRTAILCMLVFFIYVIAKGHRDVKRYIAFVVLLITLGLAVLMFFPQFSQLKNLFLSVVYFWNDEFQRDLGIGGSTMDLRFRQLIGIISVVNYHFLEGLGYDYHHYFYEELGGYYKIVSNNLAGFESILFSVYSNSGLIGLYALFKMYFNNLNLANSLVKSKERYYSYAFIISFLLAAIMTNYAGSSYLFFIFLAMNLIQNKHLSKKSIV